MLFRKRQHFCEAPGNLLAERLLTVSFCDLGGIRGNHLVTDNEAKLSYSFPVFNYFQCCCLVWFQNVGRCWITSISKQENGRVKGFITRIWDKNLYPMDYFLSLLRNDLRLSNHSKHDHSTHHTVIKNSSPVMTGIGKLCGCKAL